jgi:colanic acid biosynthesis glycosyl transferase WcaI
MVTESRLGWVVTPDRPDELAQAIRTASVSADASMAERAVAAARDFNLERAMTGYASLIDALLQASKPEGRP